ncbi:AAA family ATPase [Paraburkholderia sp. FT54]|uniref:trifunctional serine/threonine-protein kinase/ATP-binding protein/sensor histidine kinase n=1 Tax=Paraburkholderia sp. FT54 TaxID=3074437 RepID=UPI0028775202|nr:AAA family ATPase [Paraburkholderia sp. FT54]WNC95076.1 AAA family ATPase [Paraburkholderia sp. FT54]
MTAGSALYRARRLTDGKPVLLKLLPEDAGTVQSARFKREYLLLQTLKIAGVARPLTLIDDRGRLVLVLEDFSGESLETELCRSPRPDLLRCLTIAHHLADALVGIDAAHIIHRDLRPANILVAPETGHVLLVDFSLATTHAHTVSPEDVVVSVGEWAYMSPEQTGRMNRPVDYRTDCYSMGVLLYRLLTGQLPFQASDPLEWTHCHIARMPPPPCDIVPTVPQPVSDIVMKLLAKLPEDRYQSMRGVQSDLDRCLAQWRAAGRIEPFRLGTDDLSDRFQIPHRLYGRDQESNALLGVFELMTATGRAALATVSGYSGIGKSSLVDALRKPIVTKHGYFISGKFDQYQRDIPYATLTQAFGELVQQLLAESAARIAGWRQRLQAAVGVNGRLILDVLPKVELIIGAQPPVPALPPTEAQNRFRLVFRQFVTVFTSKAHPLVLFLDDLQWIDAASLALVEHLLTHPDTCYLLLIGAYRDNEVSAAHPLMKSLDAIHQSGTAMIDIQLAPLSVAHLNQLVADTLHAPPASCEPLTRLICERTERNPFFFIQFLDALHKEGLLRRDVQIHAWQWDLEQIKAKDFADNVVDLMLGKLRQLPIPAQEALQLAACLGNKFDLRILALVSGQAEVEQHLAPAVRENLILRTHGSGKFLHDRIQQAAYSLIPEERRSEVHLRIGRVLLSNMTADELADHLFDVANQFNRGAALITVQQERERVAELNLTAGLRAKAATAYASALAYFTAGDALVTEDGTDRHAALTFSLGFQRAECEFLNSYLTTAEQRLSMLSNRAANLIDKAAVACLRMALYMNAGQADRAVEVSLEYLRAVGVTWSAHPRKEEVQQEYEKLWQRMGNRSIEQLLELPLMTDPVCRATLDVLTAVQPPAHATDMNLYCLVAGRMANLSLEHGNSDGSGFAYVMLGMTLGPQFGDYRAGLRFGKLGVDLVEKYRMDRFKARVYACFGAFIVPWTSHIRSGRAILRLAFDTANQTGDLTFSGYCGNNLITNLLASGDPLGDVQREAESGLAFARKMRFEFVADVMTAQLRLIIGLRGLTPDFGSFNDAAFDEDRFERHLGADPGLALVTCWYWIRKLQARFHAGDYTGAIAAASNAERLLWTSPFCFEVAEYHFYDALAHAAHCDSVSADERPRHLKALSDHHQRFEMWASNCPENFAGRAALIAAEIARLEARDFDSMRLYEQAIQAAREHHFVQNEAIAYECASAFYRTRGFETIADTYMRKARDCFARWGADGKVKQIDARAPQLREEPASSAASAFGNVEQLDLLSVTKASQAISGQIVLEDLVDTLMHILLENAGAQTGHLLLARNESLVLAAEASVEQQTIQVRRHLRQTLPAQALPESSIRESVLPASIINYVRRCEERVLLADAMQPNPFAADDYFARRQPKSVLCLPIMRRSALIGLLYLENNLATHAFPPERVTVLELLASQAAISLENALLYADLRRENSERKLAEEELRVREARIRRLVESNIIGVFFWNLAGIATDANDAFLRIVGYSREDLLSGDVQWATMTPPEYRAADARALEELRQRGSSQPYEKEYIRKDGGRIPVLVGGALMAGSEENGVAFVLDLTEQKAAEAELAARRTAAKRAEEQLQALQVELAHATRVTTLGELSASIAHEVGQPLGAIVTSGEACLRWLGHKEPQPEEVRACVQHMIGEGRRASEIVRRIRTLTRKATPHKTQLQLNDVINDVVALVQREVLNHRVSLRLELASGLPPLLGDRVQLQQVLINLVINGIQAMTDIGDNSRELLIESHRDSDGHVIVAVQDSGPGIDPKDTNRLFDAFYTTKADGMGMGLSICRSIIEAHGGEVWASNNAGHGAIFQLSLPSIGGAP